MQKVLFAIKMALVVLLSTGNLAAAQPDNPNFGSQLSRGKRTIANSARFDFKAILPDQWWVVAGVKPDAGSATAEIIPVRGENGHLIEESDPLAICRYYGIIRPIVALMGSPQIPSSYKWEFTSKIVIQPYQVSSEEVEEGAEYNRNYFIFPVGPGGTAIFRINEAAEGPARFQPAYLIPDEWANFAAPALAFIRQNAALFEPDTARINQARLRALIGDTNPFVSIAAARTLIDAHLLQGEAAQQALSQSQGWRLSVLVYLLMMQPESPRQLPPDARTDTLEQLYLAADKVIADDPLLLLIGQAIDQAKDAQTLQGLAQGLTAVMARNLSQGLFVSRRRTLLLERIARKQATLKTRTPADVYLDNLLRFVGIEAPK